MLEPPAVVVASVIFIAPSLANVTILTTFPARDVHEKQARSCHGSLIICFRHCTCVDVRYAESSLSRALPRVWSTQRQRADLRSARRSKSHINHLPDTPQLVYVSSLRERRMNRSHNVTIVYTPKCTNSSCIQQIILSAFMLCKKKKAGDSTAISQKHLAMQICDRLQPCSPRTIRLRDVHRSNSHP